MILFICNSGKMHRPFFPLEKCIAPGRLLQKIRYVSTRGMLLLTKAKRPLKFKMLCGFNEHVVKLRMHKAAPYAFSIPLNTF